MRVRLTSGLRGGGWRTVLDGAASLAMIVASVLVIRTLNRPAARGPDVAAEAVPTQLVPLGGIVRQHGNPSLALIVYSDFQCRYCAAFSLTVLPRLLADYGRRGVLAVAFKHLPLERAHSVALSSALAAECARAQGRFWEMHDSLFSIPVDPSEVSLLERARLVGLEEREFAQCLDASGTLARVRHDTAEAARLGISTTPTVLFGVVNPGGYVRVLRRWSALTSFEEIAAEIEAAVESRSHQQRPRDLVRPPVPEG